jgi:uncharacterized protein YfaS (alpha-2-macroglobulin family)
MLRMKLVDPDPAGSAGFRGSSSIPLTLSLGDGMQLTVWVTNLKTQVVKGVLTATGTATLPGQDSDTFTARVRGDANSADRLVVTLTFGSLPMGPVDFAIDVSHLTGDSGAVRAAAMPSLLNKLVSGLGP